MAAAAAPRAPTRSRGWAFTVNETEGLPVRGVYRQLAKVHGEVTWMVYQTERGEQTQHLHVQGAVWFKNAVNMAAAKKRLAGTVAEMNSMHLEPARGTAEQNRNYCTKPGGHDMVEVGSMPQQGRRKDLEDVAAAIKEGGIKQAVDQYPEAYIKYHAGMKALDTHYVAAKAPQSRKVTVYVLYQEGTGGAGKSYAAEHWDTPENTWVAGDALPRLNGYSGERTVVINEMDGKRIKYGEFKRFVDEAVSGWYSGYDGTKLGVWDTVIITSNTPPWQWWPTEDTWVLAGAGRSPLQRRVTDCWSLTGDWAMDPDSVKWCDVYGAPKWPLGTRAEREAAAEAAAREAEQEAREAEVAELLADLQQTDPEFLESQGLTAPTQEVPVEQQQQQQWAGAWPEEF